MARRDFDRWCQRACGYIYYPPDRENVSRELYDHYYDAVEALMEEGMDKEKAGDTALEAMGDARDVGKLLRRVHKPWLGWLRLACLLALIVILFYCFISFVSSNFYTLREEIRYLTQPSYSFETSPGHEDATLLARIRPSGEVKCGDYTFSVSGGWVSEAGNERWLYLVVDYSSPRFWLGPPLGLEEFTCVVEDDGTVHLPYEYDRRIQDMEYWPIAGSSSSFGEYCFSISIDEVPEWVELRFDNGRQFSLRAYTVEGGSQ